jgi:hypothetical protein
MKLTMVLVGGLLLSLGSAVHAIERSAALPYDYSNSINRVYVPACTDSQYVGVSAGKLVCKDFVAADCATGQFVTRSGNAFVCKDVSSTTTTASKGYTYYTYTKTSGNSMGGCDASCNGSDTLLSCTVSGGSKNQKGNKCTGSVSWSSGESHSCTATSTCQGVQYY